VARRRRLAAKLGVRSSWPPSIIIAAERVTAPRSTTSTASLKKLQRQGNRDCRFADATVSFSH
jgi:hypothetical protein